MSEWWRGGVGEFLGSAERKAVRTLVERVRARVPARLLQATLFGSRARGEARADSDVDVLLVFQRLPPDREPQASIAEALAERVAEETAVPVTVWSVSLEDLECGRRTPMLVDALEDGVPLWWLYRPLPPLPFTPRDARRCARALLDRVSEGAAEVEEHLARGEWPAAQRRVRDDLVRMCTAALLLRGVTRPRRGDAVRAFERLCLRGEPVPTPVRRVLRWGRRSYAREGRDEEASVPTAPGGLGSARRIVEGIRRGVERRLATLDAET